MSIITLKKFLINRGLYSYAKEIDILIKESAPLEGFYDAISKEKLEDEEIYDEEEPRAVYEYKEKFQHISQNIFIFYFEYEDLETPEGKRVQALARDSYGSFRRVEETGTSLKVLDYFPKINSFLMQECESKNIDFESIIVIFMSRLGRDSAASKSPEFIIHDLGHMVLGEGDEEPDADRVIRTFMQKRFSELYKNENGEPLDILYKRRIEALTLLTNLSEREANLVDWGNHIFGKAVSREKNYIKTPKFIDRPEYVESGSKEMRIVRYFLADDCQENKCAKSMEKELEDMCNKMVSNIEGKVFINFI